MTAVSSQGSGLPPDAAPVSVLILDADPGARRSIAGIIAERSGRRFAAVTCATPDEAAAAGKTGAIVIADLDTIGGPSGVARIGGRMIATSANGSLAVAVAAMRSGAADFLPKPIGAKALIEKLEAMLAEAPAAVRIARPALPAAAGAGTVGDFMGFIGRTPVMRALYETIGRVAASPAPVFITGETGTGKDMTAEAIHALAGTGRPFVALNCGAIPRDLMESEIFGHVRGAFTGASENRTGAAELAHGGILFLDELAEMDVGLQAKLLRFAQSGAFRPVGASETKHARVRIISAMNRVPADEIAAGRLRSDLYYRLNVLPIHLVPLRERHEDIPLLVQAFLARFAAEEGKAAPALTDAMLTQVSAYPWPGNVRELANAMRRAIVFGLEALSEAVAQCHGSPDSVRTGRVLPYAEQERAIIEAALATLGSPERAAAALKIAPSTIYRKRAVWAAMA